MKISIKTRQIAAAISVVVALGFCVGLFIFQPDTVAVFFSEILLVAIVIVLAPSAILEHVNQKWMNGIEDQMPVLVRGISESQETGITFIKAIEKVVEDKMIRPPLSDEVKKLTVQMSWGLSFEDALKGFRNRINSSIVNRFCTLVLEASRSGGQIRKVFTATSGFMEDMRQMDRETTSQMKPYTIVVYAAFFVFAFTSVVLVRSFFAPLQGLPQILSPLSVGGVSDLKDFFYRTMLISALVGGLMAGKIGERRVAGGLKHSIVLMVVGYFIFYFLIPPNWAGK
ncbi:MAG: type II secretion system F family protein [Candidatus Bathyarchaeia archaeon]